MAWRMGAASPKSEKLGRLWHLSNRVRPDSPPRFICERLAGRKNDPRDEGCPGRGQSTKTERGPVMSRDRSRVFGHVAQGRARTLRSLYVLWFTQGQGTTLVWSAPRGTPTGLCKHIRKSSGSSDRPVALDGHPVAGARVRPVVPQAWCWTQRLSQKAIEFSRQRNRHWNSGFAMCS